MYFSRVTAGLLAVGMTVLGAEMGRGQEYPNKTIRIVTSGTGGSSDFMARLMVEGLKGPLGQPLIVDNRSQSHIPMEVVAKAPPDGYTLLVFGATLWLAPQMKTGKVRGLAVTSAQPSALFPELPTIAASGLTGYEAVGMSGIWAPAGTPEAIVKRLNQEAVRFIKMPEGKERLLSTGVEAVGSSPEEFKAAIESDIARMGKVIKAIGLRLD